MVNEVFDITQRSVDPESRRTLKSTNLSVICHYRMRALVLCPPKVMFTIYYKRSGSELSLQQ